MADWGAALGAGLSSLSRDALGYLYDSAEQKRRAQAAQAESERYERDRARQDRLDEEARKQRDFMNQQSVMSQGGVSASDTDRQFNQANESLNGGPASAAVPYSDMVALARDKAARTRGGRKLTLPDGSEYYLDSDRSDAAIAARRQAEAQAARDDRTYERSRQDKASDFRRANEGAFRVLSRPGGPLEGADYEDYADVDLSDLVADEQNRRSLAQQERLAMMRTNGNGSGSGGGGTGPVPGTGPNGLRTYADLTPQERAGLSAAQTAHGKANTEFQRAMSRRPNGKSLFGEATRPESMTAGMRREMESARREWAASDSTPYADALRDASDELTATRQALGMEMPPDESAEQSEDLQGQVRNWLSGEEQKLAAQANATRQQWIASEGRVPSDIDRQINEALKRAVQEKRRQAEDYLSLSGGGGVER